MFRTVLTHNFDARSDLGTKRTPMRHSEPIEVDGFFLGAAVDHEMGVRFIAVDVRVTEMHQTVWPTVEDARRSAHELFCSSHLDEQS